MVAWLATETLAYGLGLLSTACFTFQYFFLVIYCYAFSFFLDTSRKQH